METKRYKVIDLSFLLKATRDIAESKNFQSVAYTIFDFIDNLIPFNMAVIYSVNREHKELEVVSCRGSDVEKLKERVSFKIGEGAVGWVAQEKKALLVDDVLELKKIQVRQFYDEDPIIRSFLAVPLIAGNILIGILSISCSKPHQYNKSDVEMITIIASQVAALLELNNEINAAKRFSNHILENINSGVIVIDAEYKIMVFNKAAEKISGYSSRKVIGKSILKLPLKENESDWYIVESLLSQKTFFEKSGYLIRKDGEHINIRVSTSILRNDDSSIKGCICIFRDNSEIDRLQQQIIRAEKLAALGRVTSGITHEMRNPLLPIRTASQLLLTKIRKKDGNQEIIKLLNIINEESERLNRFLDQFAGMDKNALEAEGRTLVKEAIEETMILMKHGLRKNKINFNIDCPKEDSYVSYTKDQLKQVFINLFLNSIDAINSSEKLKPREIHIELTEIHDRIIIKFWDTGCGIKQDDLNNIFDPFFTTKENGTGLGLPIMYNIITSAGGEISVNSKLDEGTKFTILMPLADEEEVL